MGACVERAVAHFSPPHSTTGKGSPPATASKGAALWPRRMLAAGGWQLLSKCLLVNPESSEMQRVVAIGFNYLAKEVGGGK